MNGSNKTRMMLLAALAVIVGGSLFVISQQDNNNADDYVNNGSLTAPQATEPPSGQTSSSNTTESLLLYLIEEEKLAHDVYTVMAEKYGSKVFGNILQSEQTHQQKVLSLLQARNIEDPRSQELGVFQNKELQELYNKLISQGNINATEAYKVGVQIEEKDIADISAQLATATDTDVIDTLEVLRKGSENHLRAFNKQL